MYKNLTALFLLLIVSSPSSAEKAIFAGGCFWCMESDFQEMKGIRSVISGYTGGTKKNPAYKEVTYGNTGHYESVEIDFDPSIVSYSQLLNHFWVNIDPFDAKGQFCDKGPSYLSAIFPLNKQQRDLAEKSVLEAQQKLASKKPFATRIIDATAFYPAEKYHQDYYIKNPNRYKYYRWNCGRNKRLKALWGASFTQH